MAKIQRFFDNLTFSRIEKDFAFLFPIIIKSVGDLDFQIRNNYFNLYVRGNSLAKIEPRASDYLVSINTKFVLNDKHINFLQEKYTDISKRKDYYSTVLSPKQLHPFFSRSILDKLSSNIKKINFKEELFLEQSFISDNLENPNWIIIDRQITDTALKHKRMDILALRKDEVENSYSFVVLEVKLGNNPELSDSVAGQLDAYIQHICNNIHDYKIAYQKNYEQKYKLGLINTLHPPTIRISNNVDGKIIVGWYSGIGKRQIKMLCENHPKYSNKIKACFNELP